MPQNDHILPFWKGKFSQWTIAPMKIGGITYNCAEQWMMASKARHFGDLKSLDLIMKEQDPAKQQKLGRGVTPYDEDEWNMVAKAYVFIGNSAKFSQHPDLKQKLLDTGDKILVEASPFDKKWGVGLDKSDDRIWDKSQWQGANWLGEVLMAVRDLLDK